MEATAATERIREQELVCLVNEYEVQLLRLCCLLLQDAALAEDAVQETFIKAYRGLDSFRGDSSQKTWLTRIAVNTCRDMQRGAWFRRIDRSVQPEELPPAAAPFAQEHEEVTLAIAALPLKLREPLLLYYYQDMPEKDVAASLGVTTATVSKRLAKARTALRIELERRHFHG